MQRATIVAQFIFCAVGLFAAGIAALLAWRLYMDSL